MWILFRLYVCFNRSFPIPTAHPPEDVILTKDSTQSAPRDRTCVFHTCFDVYYCGYNDETRISIFIYSPTNYQDKNGIALTLPISQEYSEILEVS